MSIQFRHIYKAFGYFLLIPKNKGFRAYKGILQKLYFKKFLFEAVFWTFLIDNNSQMKSLLISSFHSLQVLSPLEVTIHYVVGELFTINSSCNRMSAFF